MLLFKHQGNLLRLRSVRKCYYSRRGAETRRCGEAREGGPPEGRRCGVLALAGGRVHEIPDDVTVQRFPVVSALRHPPLHFVNP